MTAGTLRIAYRLAVPRQFRALEFKPGIEPPSANAVVTADTPATGLLELERIKP